MDSYLKKSNYLPVVVSNGLFFKVWSLCSSYNAPEFFASSEL